MNPNLWKPGVPRSRDPRVPVRGGSGMTLVELLVALLVAGTMALLAYNLFSTTNAATRSGMARSTIIQEIYVAETRLRMDFASIIGPSSAADSAAGAIIIIPAMRSGLMPVRGHTGGTAVSKLRSDQLVMFYDARHGGLIRDTGSGLLQKSLTRTGVSSAQTKIWMGHVKRASGESTLATDWTVGRQSTLLLDPDASTVNTPTGLETAGTLPVSDPRAGFSPLNPASQSSDVVPFGLEEVANWMRAPGRTNDQMIAAFAVPPNDNTNYTNMPTVVTQPLSDGVFDASDLFSSYRIFLSHRSEFIVQYSADLDCNGLTDTTGATPYTGTIQWYPKDTDIFDFASANHGAAMTPVVFYPQDDQARVVHMGYYQGAADAVTGKDAGGTVRYWKNSRGHWTPYPPITNPAGLASGTYQFGDGLSAANYATAMSAYAARHNGWQPTTTLPPVQSKWPQLIRIRYRVHDPRAETYSFNEEFPFNKRDDDGDGVVDNADGREARCCGVWAEHIFSIPYPRVN